MNEALLQNLIAAGIGLVAAAYLCKRWWPSAMALFKPGSAQAQPGCGDPAANQVQAPSGSCSSGCGSCGASGTASKDHRIHIVKRPRA